MLCKHTQRVWFSYFLKKGYFLNFHFTLQVKVCGTDSPFFFLAVTWDIYFQDLIQLPIFFLAAFSQIEQSLFVATPFRAFYN